MDIFELVEADDGAAIRELLAQDPGAAGARDEAGISPLTRALYRGNRDAFAAIRESVPLAHPWDRLLAGEAEGIPAPDAWSADGFTPLHLAAYVHNAAAARLLLEAGADPNVLSRASFARVSPLGTCAFAGATEVARVLLEYGADPTIAEDDRFTPRAVAEANGNTELAALLREAGGRG
jgi:ankyrin repeat protein